MSLKRRNHRKNKMTVKQHKLNNIYKLINDFFKKKIYWLLMLLFRTFMLVLKSWVVYRVTSYLFNRKPLENFKFGYSTLNVGQW